MWTADQIRVMSAIEFAGMIRARSHADLAGLLTFLKGYAPEAMAQALTFQSDPDAYIDRILREIPSAAAGHDDTCRLTPKGDAALSAEPVKCLDKYDRLGNTDYCQSGKGHDGQHEGHMGRRWNAEVAANPPHHATLAGEKSCTAPDQTDKDSGYICTAQDGHDGDHVAYMPGGGEYHRWPVAGQEPLAPCGHARNEDGECPAACDEPAQDEAVAS